MAAPPSLPVHTRRGRRDPERLLLMLHASGEEEGAFAGYGSLLDPEGRFLVAAPRGPLPLRRGNAWYRMSSAGPEVDTFFPALDAVHRCVDELCTRHGLAREAAVFGGFSQGAALALAAALGDSGRAAPAGLLFLSGYLPEPPGLAYRKASSGAPRNPAVLAIHGRADSMVVPERGRRAADAMERWGYAVDRRELDIDHRVELESLLAARDWLKRVV